MPFAATPPRPLKHPSTFPRSAIPSHRPWSLAQPPVQLSQPTRKPMRPTLSNAPSVWLIALALSASCSDNSTSKVISNPSGDSVHTLAAGGGLSGSAAAAGAQGSIQPPYLQDPNQGGTATSLFVADFAFGRLVDVLDVDPSSGDRRIVFRDLVVGPNIASDGVDYELTRNLAQQDELTILHSRGTAAFAAALAAAEAARVPIQDKGLPPLALPPWTQVARNAALSLRFDDLLDVSTIDATTVQLFVGAPPFIPFEARVRADGNHGGIGDPDGDGVPEFYTTRVTLDLTVSELEAQSGPPFAINELGLPAAASTNLPNALLRLPTQPFPLIGLNQVLANPSGSTLSFLSNGTNDPNSPTLDLIRAFRSGGETSVTGDPFNGFLPDVTPPRAYGEFGVSLMGGIVPDPFLPMVFDVPQVTYADAACAASLATGDVLLQGAFWGVVINAGVLVGPDVLDLRVRKVDRAPGGPSAGGAAVWHRFDAQLDNGDCYAAYTPLPGTLPNLQVSPNASVVVRFDEPMDASTLSPFGGFTVSKTAGVPLAQQRINGEVLLAPTLREATFVPTTPLSHIQGAAETYHVQVGTLAAVRDVAGNALADALDSVSFQLDPTAPTLESGNLVLRFDTTDEIGGDGFPEVRGQFGYDLVNGRLLPRPVQRFEAEVSRNNPLPSVWTPFGPGVQTPLNPLGSKLQQVWRYADLGFAVMDEAFTNVDVEGLSWSPVGGQVISDVFPEFQIGLSHSLWLPDEMLNPLSGFPQYPSSGLTTSFDNNFLASGGADVVHPKPLGYTISPADLYLGASGAPLMPYPLNEGAAPGQGSTYLWRDTALTTLGGAQGTGVPLGNEDILLGVQAGSSYPSGAVPSIGLPLLMEFRCYPTAMGLGLNAFDVSLAANSSARPNFRAFSAGGFNGSQSYQVDPDLETIASGGFDPSGLPTQGVDNVAYMGAIELLTRTSRVHTLWLDTRSASPDFAQSVVQSTTPVGTSVSVVFRGATAIVAGLPGQGNDVRANAAALDPYGNPLPSAVGSPQFLNGDSSWKSDIDLLDGARYVQVRIDFRGNAATNASGALEGLGLSWTK